jgi:hypothetical protein
VLGIIDLECEMMGDEADKGAYVCVPESDTWRDGRVGMVAELVGVWVR